MYTSVHICLPGIIPPSNALFRIRLICHASTESQQQLAILVLTTNHMLTEDTTATIKGCALWAVVEIRVRLGFISTPSPRVGLVVVRGSVTHVGNKDAWGVGSNHQQRVRGFVYRNEGVCGLLTAARGFVCLAVTQPGLQEVEALAVTERGGREHHATATVVWAGGDGGWHDHQAWEVVVSDERSASSCEGMGRLSRFSIGDCIGRTAQVYRAGAANNTICEPEQNWE
ncbi:hypothetical protein Tco_1069721 [Tanacetum coccineum]|uniref:Uncharacterized protein n=1 Tax=Tanacetum coccineum TaxID=301880 RepID=A0ABQ5HKR6_9ASTR